MRRYKIHIEKYENSDVLLNLMLLDKQIQDLEHNYKMVRGIRDKEKDFSQLVDYLKDNFSVIHKRFDNMMNKE